jgi:hypothetical protein
MMNYFKKLFRQIYAKYLKQVRYNNSQNLGNTQNERICKSICYRMINNPHSKFLIAPLSGKRYIKNEVLKVFIILDDKKVTITNHIYHYDVILNQRDFDRVTHMYDNKTEQIRNEFENEMMSQIMVSLSTILHKISEKI